MITDNAYTAHARNDDSELKNQNNQIQSWFKISSRWSRIAGSAGAGRKLHNYISSLCSIPQLKYQMREDYPLSQSKIQLAAVHSTAYNPIIVPTPLKLAFL